MAPRRAPIDLEFTPAEAAFRTEVREFYATALPARFAENIRLGQHLEKHEQEEWHAILVRRGWLVPHWPVEWGGTGWSVVERYIFDLESSLANAPRVLPCGVNMLAPVLLECGSEAHRKYWLPRMLDGSDCRCQGYSEDGGGAAIADAMAAGTLALCAEALGLMEVIRDATVEYLRTRVQFGEPIGRNQALQHRMATVLLEIEQARSAVINAAAALDRAGPDRERVLSAAKYTIGKTGTFVAEEAIRLHGGIGMTWELAMTHFAKRLVLINHQLGDEDYHLTRYIALARAA